MSIMDRLFPERPQRTVTRGFMQKTAWPYFDRYVVIETPWFGILINHLLEVGDEFPDFFHDHPYHFVSFGLRRNYDERWLLPDDTVVDRPRRWFRFRRIDTMHNTVPDRGGAWTLLIHGPWSSEIGFRSVGTERLLARDFMPTIDTS